MLKKTIEYTNFNDEEKTMEAYFHLGKADIARISADPTVLEDMKRATETNNTKLMLACIERLVRLAYGVRSEDGERFVKTQEVQDAFIQSAAYEEFLADLLGGTGANFSKFMTAVFPEKMMKELTKTNEGAEAFKMLKGEGSDEAQERVKKFFAEPPNPESNKGTPAEEDTRPAWVREKRKPNPKELRGMSKEEMMDAFSKYNMG